MEIWLIYTICIGIIICKLYFRYSANQPPVQFKHKFQELKDKLNGDIDNSSTIKGKYKGYNFNIRVDQEFINVALRKDRASNFKLYSSNQRYNPPLMLSRNFEFILGNGKKFFVYSNEKVKTKYLFDHESTKNFYDSIFCGGKGSNGIGINNFNYLSPKKDVSIFKISKSHIGFCVGIDEKNIEYGFIEDALNRLISISKIV
ncbi:MAG: hypothetical protein GY707_04410 [Desulfobacteraceae bacterium]|nr:hypothetical protein [Desulfobacteraceae bacterium]